MARGVVHDEVSDTDECTVAVPRERRAHVDHTASCDGLNRSDRDSGGNHTLAEEYRENRRGLQCDMQPRCGRIGRID